jgi:hypothetical protein
VWNGGILGHDKGWKWKKEEEEEKILLDWKNTASNTIYLLWSKIGEEKESGGEWTLSTQNGRENGRKELRGVRRVLHFFHGNLVEAKMEVLAICRPTQWIEER